MHHQIVSSNKGKLLPSFAAYNKATSAFSQALISYIQYRIMAAQLREAPSRSLLTSNHDKRLR